MNFASILLLKRSSPRLASTLSSNYGRRIEIGPAPVRIVRSGSHSFLTTSWWSCASLRFWYFSQCLSYFCFKFNLLYFPCSFPVQALPVPLRYLALFVWELLLYFSPRTFSFWLVSFITITYQNVRPCLFPSTSFEYTFPIIKDLGASGNSMGDMTEGRNLAILEAWKTKNSMRSY